MQRARGKAWNHADKVARRASSTRVWVLLIVEAPAIFHGTAQFRVALVGVWLGGLLRDGFPCWSNNGTVRLAPGVGHSCFPRQRHGEVSPFMCLKIILTCHAGKARALFKRSPIGVTPWQDRQRPPWL